MSFDYADSRLCCESVSLSKIAAAAGTPAYVYSRDSILKRYSEYDRAFGDQPHTICYAVKANSNLSILRLLAEAGSGFDIVSGGELFRVLKAGGAPGKIVFSGVGKTAEEIELALSSGIFSFNSESEAELELISRTASRHNLIARIALRVNPDVDAATHPYISTGLKEHKFGIDIDEVEGVYERAAKLPGLALESVSCHIGSQILDSSSILEAVGRMVALVERLRAKGLPIEHLDLGGGIGVAYRDSDSPPEIKKVVQAMCEGVRGHNLHVVIEPGRSLVAEAGVLLTRVLYVKQNGSKRFVIVDAAMNDLLRPSLYKAHHEILPVASGREDRIVADVVGPVCETGDFIARDRELAGVKQGDLLAVMTAGAYGFVMASNYNARPRPAEVLVEGNQWRIVRNRETYDELVRGE